MNPTTSGRKYETFTSLLLLLFMLSGVFTYGWVTDDAFINFRVVHNLLDGNGPVFNVGERVQVFTSPLWFALQAMGGAVGFELYHWSLFLGYFFSIALAVCFFLLASDSRHSLIASVLIVGILLPSETFRTFQTSGLENSLVNLLLVLIVMKSSIRSSSADLLTFVFLCSLLLLTRLDQLFIILPISIYYFFSHPQPFLKKFAVSIAGVTPVLAWHGFSITYYGFLFPNTKYAKIGGRDTFESLYYGVQYFSDFFLFEPAQFLMITFFPLVVVYKYARKNWLVMALALGIIFQILYIATSASDYMRGRFMLSSLIVSTTMLLLILKDLQKSDLNVTTKCIGIAILLVFAIYNKSVVSLQVPNQHSGVHNERDYYKEFLAVDWSNPHRYYNHPWAKDAQKLNDQHTGTTGVIIGVNGQRSFHISSNVKLVDLVGLPDAFIARCAVTDASRAGHFKRDIPQEYLHEQLTGERIDGWQDAHKEQLWRDLQIIISDKVLFSGQRFHAMQRVWSDYGY
jgi:arabinofuranosyltransferase